MILNVYKPKGWTSFDVVAKLRAILGARKIGHAGTLDPLAEGVLIVLTGEDTKKQHEYMKMRKEYVAEIGFGASSETYDLESELNVSACRPNLEEVERKIREVIPTFMGEIEQIVPPYSAKKIKGVRMYKKAREGKLTQEQLPVKRITIYSFKVLGFYEEEVFTQTGKMTLPVMRCKIECSSGTYIRSIANDIGKIFEGGVLISLIRARVGPFLVEESKRVEDVRPT